MDSTSSYASSQLALGMQAPFAVMAQEQTAGRGRRGHKWQSPPGNLYITLVIEAGPLINATNAGWLPLKCGVILAELIHQITGIRVTLKWPNDLMIYGKKVGGILVESSVTVVGQEPKWGTLLIGIGLNLKSKPDLLDSPYQSATLAEFISEAQPLIPSIWGRIFSRDFETMWQNMSLEQTRQKYQEWALNDGQPWSSLTDGSLALQQGIKGDGALSLRKLSVNASQSEAESLVLNSAHHEFTWIYSHHRDVPLVVADVGNSLIKIALFARAHASMPEVTLTLDIRHSEGELIQILSPLRSRIAARQWPLHCLSVNQNAMLVLKRVAESLGFVVVTIKKRQVLRREAMLDSDSRPKGISRYGGTYPVSELGIDRLAMIEAYLARLTPETRGHPEKLAILLAAGTATTIDVVAHDGWHYGGVILPGMATALHSLHQKTGLLPDLAPIEQATIELGQTTSSAMQMGVLSMTVGAAERLIRQTINLIIQTTNTTSLFSIKWLVTGGLGPLIIDHVNDQLGADAQYEPHLVLSGARRLVLAGG